MKEKSWACTLITQLSLCMVAYIAINIGQHQNFTRRNISNQGNKQNDLYFVSVIGGFKPCKEQTLLLQQVWFVLPFMGISFLGKDWFFQVFFCDLGVGFVRASRLNTVRVLVFQMSISVVVD